MKKYFSKTPDETLKEFNVTLEGLTSTRAEDIRNSVGENILNEIFLFQTIGR